MDNIGGLCYITARGAHTMPGACAAGHSRQEAVAMVPLNVTGQAASRTSATSFAHPSPDISPEAGGQNRGDEAEYPRRDSNSQDRSRGILSPFAGDVEPRRTTTFHSETSRDEKSNHGESGAIANSAPPDNSPDIVTRILRRVRRDDNGCWLWQGSVCSQGYGAVRYQGRTHRTHRIMATTRHGPVSDGLLVLHTCDVRRCCNPEHLYYGTHKDNNRDAIDRGRLPFAAQQHQLQKTHCPQGHPYSEENTNRPPRGGRQCRACGSANSRRQAARRKASATATAPLVFAIASQQGAA